MEQVPHVPRNPLDASTEDPAGLGEGYVLLPPPRTARRTRRPPPTGTGGSHVGFPCAAHGRVPVVLCRGLRLVRRIPTSEQARHPGLRSPPEYRPSSGRAAATHARLRAPTVDSRGLARRCLLLKQDEPDVSSPNLVEIKVHCSFGAKAARPGSARTPDPFIRGIRTPVLPPHQAPGE